MRIKGIIDEDFVNYRKPAMFISTCSCSGKCCTEAGIPLSVCQNHELNKAETINISDQQIIERYLDNDITRSIVFGGLEPFEQFDELHHFIHMLRTKYLCYDDVVIYTGYYPHEIDREITILEDYQNIVVKFGRYKPNHEPHYDEILGVNLASDNQFAQVVGW